MALIYKFFDIYNNIFFVELLGKKKKIIFLLLFDQQ